MQNISAHWRRQGHLRSTKGLMGRPLEPSLRVCLYCEITLMSVWPKCHACDPLVSLCMEVFVNGRVFLYRDKGIWLKLKWHFKAQGWRGAPRRLGWTVIPAVSLMVWPPIHTHTNYKLGSKGPQHVSPPQGYYSLSHTRTHTDPKALSDYSSAGVNRQISGLRAN